MRGKYKIWDNKLNRWVHDDYDLDDLDLKIKPNGDLVAHDQKGRESGAVNDEHDIVWFTGLKDKNGKEIYEGDILHMFDTTGDPYFNNLVEWVSGAFGYYSNKIKPWKQFHSFANHNYIACPIIEDAEVIGNIHEHPELLKEC
jgi:hypothetical protein